MPLFPELRPYLDECFELAEPGTEDAITRYRNVNANLRTQLLRIIKHAGLKPWPKLFQNLRSTRQTELEESFPSHVVCSWIGNTEAVAKKHYLQVTDDHFEKALQNPMQQAHVTACNGSQVGSTAHEKTPVLQGVASDCDYLQNRQVGVRGLEPRTSALSELRSNHLSYTPLTDCRIIEFSDYREMHRFPFQPAEKRPSCGPSMRYSQVRARLRLLAKRFRRQCSAAGPKVRVQPSVPV